MLGAGMARFAWDLLPIFKHVIAAEASVPAAVLHDMLQRGEVITCEPEEQSAYTIADQGRDGLVHHPHLPLGKEPPPGHGDLVYCVADASAMPLADRSISPSLSIYFTMFPALPAPPRGEAPLEAGRGVPDFGPLAYHFPRFRGDVLDRGGAEHLRVPRLRDPVGSLAWDCKRTEATTSGSSSTPGASAPSTVAEAGPRADSAPRKAPFPFRPFVLA